LTFVDLISGIALFGHTITIWTARDKSIGVYDSVRWFGYMKQSCS